MLKTGIQFTHDHCILSDFYCEYLCDVMWCGVCVCVCVWCVCVVCVCVVCVCVWCGVCVMCVCVCNYYCAILLFYVFHVF